MQSIRFTPRTLPLVAISLAAIGLGCSTLAGDVGQTPRQDSAPVACALQIDAAGGMVTFSGTATARRDIAGSYELTIERGGQGGSASIRQSGAFDLKAGDSETLGQAMLSGRRADFDARMSLQVDGTRVACGGAIDL